MKTIPCWDCKGAGKRINIKNEDGIIYGKPISCKTCGGGGVLSVYTQAELDEAVKAEREALLKQLYDLADQYYMEGYPDKHDIIYIAAESIRARNK